MAADVRSILSKLHEVEEALSEVEASVSLGHFAASLINQSANPLETLANLVYLAQADPGDTEKIREYMTMADAEVRKLTRMVTDFITYEHNLALAAARNKPVGLAQ